MYVGHVYLLETPPLEDGLAMLLSVPKRRYFEFRLLACHDAFVDLFADSTENFKYRILIGSHTNTQIELLNSQGVQVGMLILADLLNCAEYRWFWVGWEYGLVQVGKGRYMQQVLLEHHDSSAAAINHVTVGEGIQEKPQTSKWEIPVVSGLFFLLAEICAQLCNQRLIGK